MEDLQNLLEKINREGVEKAEAAAKNIIADAKARAEEYVAKAKADAAAAKAEAEKASVDYAARAKETLRQAARDTLLKVEAAVTAEFEKLLRVSVDAALSDETNVMALVMEAIRNLTAGGEIVVGPKLASALQSKMAALGGFTVVTDETHGTGFSVKLENGRVEHSFTGETVAAELAKRLRPDLAALLK